MVTSVRAGRKEGAKQLNDKLHTKRKTDRKTLFGVSFALVICKRWLALPFKVIDGQEILVELKNFTSIIFALIKFQNILHVS